MNRARARIKVLIDKVGIDAFREMVEEELEGDWVDERDFDVERLKLIDDEEANAPPPPAAYGEPERRPIGVRPLPRGERAAAAPGGLQRRRGEGHPRRPHPRAAPRPGGRSCASSRAATRAPRCSRTSSCAGCATSRSTTSGSGSASSASATPARDEITDVVSCPGTDSCKLGITSSMGLNQAVQERLESMQITDPLTKRIHVKMSGCPNGCSQHHIANIGFYGASIKVGDRTDPRLHRPPRRQLRGRRGRLRPPPQGAAARQARPRRGRALGAPLRGRARRRRGVQRLRRARRHRPLRGARSRTSRCRSSSASRHMDQFIDWSRSEPYKVERGEGECAV